MDEIVLRLPRDPEWRVVAHLVLAGLAARLDLTVEALEDWQLALAELFEREGNGEEVQIVFRAFPDQLETRFGPAGEKLVAELNRECKGVGLYRVLSTLTDSFCVESVGDERWIVLRRSTLRPQGTQTAG